MRRYISVILVAVFLLSTVEAYAVGVVQSPNPVVYRGTITGLRISGVNGTAFIDNAGATVPTYADGSHQIEIYDSAGRFLRGVLSAAGTGETLDVDLLLGFNFTSGWTALEGGAITDADTYSSVDGGGVRSGALFTVGALYKRSYASDNAFSYCRVSNAAGTQLLSATITSGAVYHTGITNYLYTYLRNSITGTTNVATMTAQQVLTPSADGAVIVSAKSGAVQNFGYKNASFAYGAASYYVIVKKLR